MLVLFLLLIELIPQGLDKVWTPPSQLDVNPAARMDAVCGDGADIDCADCDSASTLSGTRKGRQR